MRLARLVLLLLTLVSAGTVWAAVSSSANYYLDSDSLNSTGASSTSATYGITDSAGETATGNSASAMYQLQAGYQAMVPSPLSLSTPSDVTLSPTISAGSGGRANGQARWHIISNGGFSFYINSSPGKPGLRGAAGSFTNYSGITLNWTPSPSVPTFGFNPFGTYAYTNYYSAVPLSFNDVPTGNCGFSIGISRESQDGYCWDGFTEGNKLIGQASSGPINDDLTINFRADYQTPVPGALSAGTYQANLVVTLIGT
jgi:hypothetical protein